jgi:small-conductance mechanosensitive channel
MFVLRPRSGWPATLAVALALAALAPGTALSQSPAAGGEVAGSPQGPEPASPGEPSPQQAAAVVFRGQTVFVITEPIGSLTPSERAERTSMALRRLARPFRPDEVRVAESEVGSEILVGNALVSVATDRDAAAAGRSRATIAAQRAESIRLALARAEADFSTHGIVAAAGWALGLTLALALVFWVFRRLRPVVEASLKTAEARLLRSSRLGETEAMRLLHRTGALALRGLMAVVAAGAVVGYVVAVLTILPWTQGGGWRLAQLILSPIVAVLRDAVGWLPNLFYLIAIAALTYYLLTFIRLVFDEIGRGNLRLGAFEPEWAEPTFRLVRILALAVALVMMFPYFPGSGSDAFKGVSLFLGVLVSLSSSAALSNFFAGTVLRYTRSFRVGDRITIGDVEGEVTETRALVTKLRTHKNVEVSIPNSLVIGSTIRNFSVAARQGGVILHTKVSIGYDSPWRQVHALLLLAAERTEGLMREPAPFVHQQELADFYVVYELNAYTRAPERMPRIYAELHHNIQDAFNEHGVQILSPHYESDRDRPTFVPKERWYEAPARRPEEESGAGPSRS